MGGGACITEEVKIGRFFYLQVNEPITGGWGWGVKISNLSGGKHYPQFEQMGHGVNW